MADFSLIATATFGLEAVVVRELEALGYAKSRVEAGRIHFDGDLRAMARANLWLRSADRVLVRVGEFEATDFGMLFDGVRELPWERWIGPEAAFPVRGRSVKSQLASVPACQRMVKKAVAERLLAAHRVTRLPEVGPPCKVEVAMLNDRAVLTLDTSGVGLHKRGYRTEGGVAPLKETLAAGLVQLSYWRPERSLLDPFCGSGTIPIEAALIARNRAPGLGRGFAAERWAGMDRAVWAEARDEAAALEGGGEGAPIRGSDCDGAVLAAARQHARQAGVAELVVFEQQRFEDCRCEDAYGVLITNPPYGERLEDRETTEALYARMPTVLARFATWSHYIIVADRQFERIAGRQADRRRKLYNGRIECTYYQFFGPPPPPPRSEAEAEAEAGGGGAAAFNPLPEQADEQAEMFRRRLEKRARHFRRWPTRQQITCYRVYDRDVPGVPLVIDRYEDALHVSELEYRRHTPSEHEAWLELMLTTVSEVLEVPRERVFFKRRRRQQGDTQYERLGTVGEFPKVSEGGLRFYVNLTDYLDTGLFLDHRIAREMVRELATGTRFLNLFCYTGAFTVYAAAGGAAATTSVDLSATYLDWARDNLRLNGLADPQRHRLVRSDAAAFLEGLGAEERFDLAVVDPPTFSNSKALEGVWDVQRDHAGLLNRLIPRMASGGVIFFSTNFQKFRFDTAAIEGAREVREITRQTIPPDFRNPKTHQCWRITV